jgi:hypothetical protein
MNVCIGWLSKLPSRRRESMDCLRCDLTAGILWPCSSGGLLSAQTPGKIGFLHDIQAIFQAYRVSCHGRSQQMNGLRLDRRSAVSTVLPGSSENSHLYRKLIGTDCGLQMPPTGPLRPEQIRIIKEWIDQGADWPDGPAGEAPPPLTDPTAARMMNALCNGDREAFKKMLRENPKGANPEGAGGSTPLMDAALHGNAGDVFLPLDSGTNPNIENEAGATALLWALDDAEKNTAPVATATLGGR